MAGTEFQVNGYTLMYLATVVEIGTTTGVEASVLAVRESPTVIQFTKSMLAVTFMVFTH
jgi:hypothetical protein